jgi:hypothetical protein
MSDPAAAAEARPSKEAAPSIVMDVQYGRHAQVMRVQQNCRGLSRGILKELIL